MKTIDARTRDIFTAALLLCASTGWHANVLRIQTDFFILNLFCLAAFFIYSIIIKDSGFSVKLKQFLFFAASAYIWHSVTFDYGPVFWFLTFCSISYLFPQSRIQIFFSDSAYLNILPSLIYFYIQSPALHTLSCFFSACILIAANKNPLLFRKKGTPWIFTGSVILFLLTTFQYSTQKSGRIIFDESKKSMESAESGLSKNYSESAGFGHKNLLRYLESLNYSCSINKEKLSDSLLSGCTVLTIIYPLEQYSSSEISSIKKFVYNGGRILFIGDHTNIDYSSDVLNSVCSEFGITYNFDTVWCMDNSRRNLMYSRHPVLNRIPSVFFSVGCSLSLKNPAMPLIQTRCSDFSDTGNIQNIAGAFLGNQRKDSRESSGPLVLAAHSCYGKGAVIALADSSFFQNALIHENYAFASSVFSWLFSYRPLVSSTIQQLLLLFTIIIFIFTPQKNMRIILALLYIFTALIQNIMSPQPCYPPQNKVLVDLSCFPKYSTYSTNRSNNGTNITVCFYELYRSGYWPIIGREKKSLSELMQYSFVILPNPQYVPRSYAQDLEQYIASGKKALIIEGPASKSELYRLYDKSGVTLGEAPLSVLFSNTEDGNIIRLPEAGLPAEFKKEGIFQNVSFLNLTNPCVIKGGNSLAKVRGFSAISQVSLGKGSYILISDEFFLSDMYSFYEEKIIDTEKLKLMQNIFEFLGEAQ